jgi:hypothetical protein
MQKSAVPFVDTPISVIERWANFYDEHHGSTTNGETQTTSNSGNCKQFSATQPPDLLHTRVRGKLGTIAFSRWNELVRIAHVEAFKKAGSYDLLRKVTRAHIKNGEYLDEGYKYVPEVGISVQGVDANRAWEHGLRLAMYLKLLLTAEVEWRHHEQAAHPGESGVLCWKP